MKTNRTKLSLATCLLGVFGTGCGAGMSITDEFAQTIQGVWYMDADALAPNLRGFLRIKESPTQEGVMLGHGPLFFGDPSDLMCMSPFKLSLLTWSGADKIGQMVENDIFVQGVDNGCWQEGTPAKSAIFFTNDWASNQQTELRYLQVDSVSDPTVFHDDSTAGLFIFRKCSIDPDDTQPDAEICKGITGFPAPWHLLE